MRRIVVRRLLIACSPPVAADHAPDRPQQDEADAHHHREDEAPQGTQQRQAGAGPDIGKGGRSGQHGRAGADPEQGRLAYVESHFDASFLVSNIARTSGSSESGSMRWPQVAIAIMSPLAPPRMGLTKFHTISPARVTSNRRPPSDSVISTLSLGSTSAEERSGLWNGCFSSP